MFHCGTRSRFYRRSEHLVFGISANSCRACRQMAVLADDAQLFTCSSDGTLALWSVADPEGRLSKRERSVPYSEEILVSKAELDVSSSLAEGSASELVIDYCEKWLHFNTT